MRPKTFSLIALSMAAFACGPLKADEASHRKAAEELMETMNMKETMSQTMDQMIKVQVQADPTLADYQETMRTFYSKYMSWGSLKEEFIRDYMDTFTESELREMTAFYRTPTGQKVVSTLPELMRD